MTVSSLFQLKRSSVGKLMLFGRHRQIDNRQNHENEGLQRNNQDVENGHGTFRILATTATDQQSQNENQLTGIHVAPERSRTERNRFGQTYPSKD